jgi:26-hydroxylase
MNPDLWEAPEDFRPERFLTEDGRRVQKPKYFIPFGAGQRMCLGDSLAEMELQLFFASLMHVFDLENPGSELPTMEGVLGATVTPRDFEVNFVPRNVEALIAANARTKSSCWNPDVRIYG